MGVVQASLRMKMLVHPALKRWGISGMLMKAGMAKSSMLETKKKPGVCYALTKDGIELPVIDVTHPCFALKLGDSEQRAIVEKFLQQGTPFHFLPRFLRSRLLEFLFRESILAQGIRQVQDSFMPGMHTYLLKLGPDMLGSAYAKPIDRKIASALPSLAVRLRLQDVANLMAGTLLPLLSDNPRRPLHFLNIAGGPAIDSLNALIVLAKKRRDVLAEREVSIYVLDLDDAGPAFGEAALRALSAEGAPLHGIRIAFRAIHYDWSEVATLKTQLDEARADGASIMCSSEGGLFEYGSDDEIEANLKVLRAAPEVLGVVGSVTRSDEPIQRLKQISSTRTRPRGLTVFGNLVRETGWQIASVIERPFSDHFVLA